MGGGGGPKLTSNVTELAVLEQEEAFLSADLLQFSNRALAPVVDDVGVRLEDAYRVADVFG